MDKKRSILNVSVSMFFRILLLVGNLLVRRYLIRYLGNEVNGLNSLFVSILDFLSVSELGIGTAITFCMYKPIVDGNKKQVSALYGLMTRLYLVICTIIFVCGCAVMPFLPYLAKGYSTEDVNIYLCFGLMLVSVTGTYLFSSKTSLINAYKNNYITTAITSGGQLVQLGMQIAVILLTESFVCFLLCRIFAVALQWLITQIVVRLRYKEIITDRQKVDAKTKPAIVKNIKAMFMHKIGGALVNTADSVIISAFIGVVVLGKYNNYTTIVSAMSGTIALFFTPLTSIIGHLYAEEGGEGLRKYYHFFHTFNFIIGTLFFLGYYAVIDNLISLCFGDGLEMAKSVSFVITVNYFIQFMRQTTLLFLDATGTFYNDRWKPLVEGIVNVILSIAFVYLFVLNGEEFAVVGVIVATIITNLLICHIVEPHVLFKYALHESAKRYYIKNYAYILLFVCALAALHFCMITNESGIVEFFANGFIAVGIAIAPGLIALFTDADFRHYLKKFGEKIKRRKDEKNIQKEQENLR